MDKLIHCAFLNFSLMDCALIILVLKGQLSFISTWLHLGKWFMFQTFNSVLFKGAYSCCTIL